MVSDNSPPQRYQLGLGKRLLFGAIAAAGIVGLAGTGLHYAANFTRGLERDDQIRKGINYMRGNAYLPGWECAEQYGYPGGNNQQVVGCFVRNYVDPDGNQLTNSRGFISPEYEIETPKPDDVFRIVCLGGSTTQGGYCHNLERILNEERTGSTEFQVVDGGVVSHDSWAVHIRYFLDVMGLDPITHEDRGIGDIDPDMVIVYSGWNDWQCNLFPHREWGMLQEYGKTGNKRFLLQTWNPWVIKHMDWFEEQRGRFATERGGREYTSFVRHKMGIGTPEWLTNFARQFQVSQDIEALRRWAQRDEVLVTALDQTIGEPSVFDDFYPERYIGNIEPILEHAREQGIQTAVTILPHAFGCRPFETINCGAMVPTINDKHAFITRVLPHYLRDLAEKHESLVIDHQSVINARDDRCTDVFQEGSDELHYSDHGSEVIGRSAFEAIKDHVPLHD